MPIPLLYHLIAVVTLAFVVLLTGTPLLESRGPSGLRSAPLFAISCATALLAWAWPGFLVKLEFNPDESQLIAMAHTAALHPIPWRFYDGGTGGPMNVFALDALHAFGFGFTYVSGRLLAVILTIVAIIATYRTIAPLSGEFAGRITAALATCFYAFASTDHAFAYFGTETLAVALLALFALVTAGAARTAERPPWLSVIAAGLLTGAIFFSKLQAIPLAAVLTLTMFVAVLQKRWPPRITAALVAAFAFSALLIPTAILVPVALAGSLHDFTISYILQPLAYAAGKRPVWFASGSIDLAAFPAFLLLAVFSGALVSIELAYAALARKPGSPALAFDTKAVPLICAIAFAGVAAYVIVKPNVPAAHYLLFGALPICAVAGSCVGYMLERSRRAELGVFAALASVVLLTASGTAVEFERGPQILASAFARSNFITESYRMKTAFSLLREIPPGSSVATWGWFPEMYVIAPIVMGYRDGFGMWSGPFQAYYLQRYVGDLEANRPPYFMDAVTDEPQPPPSLTVPANRHENYPLLGPFIRAHYALLDQADGVRLYVWKGRGAGKRPWE